MPDRFAKALEWTQMQSNHDVVMMLLLWSHDVVTCAGISACVGVISSGMSPPDAVATPSLVHKANDHLPPSASPAICSFFSNG